MTTNVYGNGTTTATAGANTVTHYYDKAGVKAANVVNIYGQFADRRSMPLKMGKTFKVSKWLHIYDRQLDPAGQVGGTNSEFAAKGYITARNITDVSAGMPTLSEGSGPANKVSIKKVTIETNFSRYGEMLDYTDEVDMFSEDMVQIQYREELGHLANMRAEDLTQLDLLSTTTIQYVGSATAIAEVGQDTTAADGSDDKDSMISYDMIRKITRRLVRNRAEKNTTVVTGDTKVDTRTVNKAFYAVIGPEIKYDLDNLTRGTGNAEEFAYIPAYKYAAAASLAEGEVGSMGDVRFIESESALVYAAQGAAVPTSYVGDLSNDGTNFDVFPVLFPTKGSFAIVGLKGQGKIKFNSQSPGKIELSNPFATQGFFSYNMWYAGIILREERLLKGYVCASK
jgi:N4-gp56 family major capsid protein